MTSRTPRRWPRRAGSPAGRPTGRTSTIAALIDRAIQRTGKPPTDQELAALLACSIVRIQHHRMILGR